MRATTGKILCLFTAAGLVAGACGGDDSSATSASGSEWPETISYATLPTADATVVQQYEPFRAYMERCLDHPFELFTGTTYVAVVEAMRTGSVHVAKFGPFAYILAADRAGAEAFATGTADPDVTTYNSVVITLEKHGLTDLQDLRGQSIAFADPASASGHIFPRAMMIDAWGVTNAEFEDNVGDMKFVSGGESIVMSVLNEEVAAGALSSNFWDTQIENYSSHENFDQLTGLAESDPIPRAVEAYDSDLPEDLKERLSECFIDVVNQEELADFREESTYEAGYVPIDDSAYDVVRTAAENLDMSPEQLLEQD